MNTSLSANKENYSTGLTFSSHEVNKDERTSLNLTPDKPLILPNGYSLEFDLKLTYASQAYGYVFKIIMNDTTSLDMISSIRKNSISVLLNSVSGSKSNSEYRYKRADVEDQWIKVKIVINPKSIKYIINGKETILENSAINSKLNQIIFGANKHNVFYTSDVAPMSVKNIIVKDNKDKVIRSWELARHRGEVVYDEVNNFIASALNAKWKIDKHAKWHLEKVLTTKQKNAQITHDSINSRIFVALKDSIYTIHLENKINIDKKNVSKGQPFIGSSSNVIYDYTNDQLISYDIENRELITYDFASNQWSGTPASKVNKNQHHNRFINPENGELVIFGGYGYYKYNAVLSSYNFSNKDWSSVDLINQIIPRYLASMGYLGENKALLLGGYGNPTGQQKELAYNLNDLYEIDLENKTSRKLGDIPSLKGFYTLSSSMVINQKKHTLLTLAYRNDLYKSSISLLEVNYESLEQKFLADSIPYNFQDTESFCDIFYSQKRDQLFAIVSQKESDGTFAIKLYSLNYPPLAEADIIQPLVNQNGLEKSTLLILLIVVIGCLGGLFIYFRTRRKAKAQQSIDNIPISINDQSLSQKTHSSSITLLGEFHVSDDDGNDITNTFTSTVLKIFSVCILESFASAKGISSKNLEDMFWYDMDKANATNNRNVNIRKLRLLLSQIKDVSIEVKNGYCQLIIGDNVYCDYLEIMRLLETAKKNKKASRELIEKIVDLAIAGPLLPNIDEEWMDKYKSNYSSELTDLLLRAVNDKEIETDPSLLIKISNVIFLYDNIDENAIQIKCRSLYQLGQKGLSKQAFDKFYNDYISILNEPPKLTYEDIISEP